MGYYVKIVESTFTIPPENLDEAYRRLCALNDRDDLKSGGRWPDPTTPEERAALGYHPNKCFAWMDPNYPAKCKDAADIFEMLSFEVEVDEDNGLRLYGYDDKTGQEELFTAAVSDLATGYIVWRGEGGEVWRETYGESKVKIEQGRLVFQ